MSVPVVNFWGDLDPSSRGVAPEIPTPDHIWDLDGGTAWVFHGVGHEQVTAPVILSDGFSGKPSSLTELWTGLEDGEFGFVSALRERGNDLILLGYTDRTRPILENATIATRCILRTIAERHGDIPLTVGGFSMGGLITRYALAKMERGRIDHQTSTYVSYDTPHRGAWLPIGLQALLPFLLGQSRDIGEMIAMINSPAAREMLRWRIDGVHGPAEQDPLRVEFLTALDRVGGWPTRPRRIGVANGRGDGGSVRSGDVALEVTGSALLGTTLYTQARGDAVVADLRREGQEPVLVRTNNLPEVDDAPGGTLFNFGLAAAALAAFGIPTSTKLPSTCFVPTVSAIAIREIDDTDNVHADVRELSSDDSGLDEYRCASTDEPHTTMTAELGTWILDRIARR